VFVEIMHEKLIEPVRSMLNDLRRQDQLRAALLAAQGVLNMLQDEPDPEGPDPLPPYFRSALERYCHRLDMDALAAKTLLRSLLLAGPRQDRSEWRDAIRTCSSRLHSGGDASDTRRLLLRGHRLDDELARVEREGLRPRFDERRLLTQSALGDLSDAGSNRLRRAMALWSGREAE